MSRQETLVQTENARVRIMELLPAEMTPRHHHSEVTDNLFGLTGLITVDLMNPDETIELSPGTRCEIAPGRKHEVRNPSSTQTASYLLVQGGGQYDFLTDER